MDDLPRIRDQLERIRRDFPASPKVSRFVIQPGFDSTGDPSLFVWVLLDDATTEDEQSSSKITPIRERIRDALREIGEERWAYVRFRTESEYREMVET